MRSVPFLKSQVRDQMSVFIGVSIPFSALTSGLLQLIVVWHQLRTTSSPQVGAECCCPPGHRRSSLWPHYASVTAASPSASRVQDCRAHTSVAWWSGYRVPCGKHCFALWRLSSSVVVICNTPWRAYSPGDRPVVYCFVRATPYLFGDWSTLLIYWIYKRYINKLIYLYLSIYGWVRGRAFSLQEVK